MNISSISFATIVAFGVGVVSGFIINGNRLEAKYNAEKIALMESVKAKEKALQDENETLQNQLKTDKQNAEKTISNLKRDLANNRVQYYANVRVSDGSATGFRETRAQLDPATAQSLIDITATGDQAIRELNYCIDAYNSLKN